MTREKLKLIPVRYQHFLFVESIMKLLRRTNSMRMHVSSGNREVCHSEEELLTVTYIICQKICKLSHTFPLYSWRISFSFFSVFFFFFALGDIHCFVNSVWSMLECVCKMKEIRKHTNEMIVLKLSQNMENWQITAFFFGESQIVIHLKLFYVNF